VAALGSPPHRPHSPLSPRPPVPPEHKASAGFDSLALARNRRTVRVCACPAVVGAPRHARGQPRPPGGTRRQAEGTDPVRLHARGPRLLWGAWEAQAAGEAKHGCRQGKCGLPAERHAGTELGSVPAHHLMATRGGRRAAERLMT
jgi:hypothetical protein